MTAIAVVIFSIFVIIVIRESVRNPWYTRASGLLEGRLVDQRACRSSPFSQDSRRLRILPEGMYTVIGNPLRACDR